MAGKGALVGEIKVAELFAGVGGFRLALEGYGSEEHHELAMPAAGPYRTVWANQWEPPGKEARQFAWRCYEERFGKGSCTNRSITDVLDDVEAGRLSLPDVDMVAGGFPCQDYSVAKPLSKSGGIEGKKGVLWWDIHRFLRLKEPRFVLLENVDRLLKSPSHQRGRDFAVMLACLSSLGYAVEWRVVNSADYGFPQRRRRTYVYAERAEGGPDARSRLLDGALARALPFSCIDEAASFEVGSDPYEASHSFNEEGGPSPFLSTGAMVGCEVATADVEAAYGGKRLVLGDVLVDEADVPNAFYVDDGSLGRWGYLKGAKKEARVSKATGFEYAYSEGAMAFPDPLDRPSRTILTSEGGAGPSRTKHAIEVAGAIRRLVPEELEALQGFPRGWTDCGMTDAQRAFCMGNALVVGIPHRIGQEVARRWLGAPWAVLDKGAAPS